MQLDMMSLMHDGLQEWRKEKVWCADTSRWHSVTGRVKMRRYPFQKRIASRHTHISLNSTYLLVLLM